MKITNPILPGFYPDPSVCRAGDDYFLVNSSFEYFPGVPIHHSKDLVNWRLAGHCLTRESQLPLRGAPASDGIYAPTIRHHRGRFYMVTTNIRGGGNFFVWADDPFGEWSEPVWLAQGGIDPSLHFGEDGKAYLTSNGTNWAAVRGIYQCEIDIATGRQLTETRFLWAGTGGAFPEAPHLFRRGKFYYLLVAEGGTAEGHMVTIARSRDPFGPFEPCPRNPVLTHRSLMGPVQATGHADFFQDHHGCWWAVFLGIRYGEYGWHHLGRETFLAPVDWDADGWPVVNGGKKLPLEMDLARPCLETKWPMAPAKDDFDSTSLDPAWVRLRNPDPKDVSLEARPGWVRLSCSSVTLDEAASPSCILRRQRHMSCKVSALVDFDPASGTGEAGLTVLLDNRHHCEVGVTVREGVRSAVLRRRIGSLVAEELTEIPPGPAVLEIVATATEYLFFATAAGRRFELGRAETRYVSTEVAGGYTGAFIGLYATSPENSGHADFDWFEYISL